METLYISKQSDVSPLKKFLEHQKTNNEEEDEEKNGREKFMELFSNTSQQTKVYLSDTYDKFKQKFEEKKLQLKQKKIIKKEKKKSVNNEPKIFVTRSSKEFAQIKIEEHFSEVQATYVYPILGACIVSFPYAMKQSGFVVGTLLLFLLTIMMDYSEYLLIQCSLVSEERNVPMMAKTLFGQIGYLFYFGLPYMFQLCILLAYFIIIGDTSSKCVNSIFQLTSSPFLLHRNVVLLLLSFLIVVVSMTQNIKRIFKWSLLSLVASSLLVVLVVVKLFTISDQIPQISHHSFKYLGNNIMQAVAVMTFALSCQHAHRLCFMSVNTNKDYDTNKPANIVSAYAMLCTIAVAVCGYTTFNAFTQGDILENYCEEDPLAGISRFVFTVFIICLFPLECQNIRFMTEELIIVHQKFKQGFYIGITILILVPTFIASLFIDCLPLLLETAGFTLAIPMVFILPQLLFLKLFPGELYTKEKLPCVISITLGLLITIFGLTITILSGHQCIHSTALLPYCNGSSELLGPLITLMALNGTSNFEDAVNFNMSRLERYGFENLTDIVNAYLS